ncbi:MAG: cytosine permease, partial [Pseudomonadota bacterium]
MFYKKFYSRITNTPPFKISKHLRTTFSFLLVALSGILMTSTAYFGFKALIILSFIAVPSITILGFYSVSFAVSSIGGFHELLKIEPQNSILFVTAVSMCIGSFISGGTLTPDFIRFAKSSK